MLTLALCLLTFIIGYHLGWYSRVIKDLLTLYLRSLRAQREALHEQRTDQSGIVQGHTVRQRGRIVDIPPLDEGNLVRSPSPEEIKRERQRAHEQDLMSL